MVGVFGIDLFAGGADKHIAHIDRHLTCGFKGALIVECTLHLQIVGGDGDSSTIVGTDVAVAIARRDADLLAGNGYVESVLNLSSLIAAFCLVSESILRKSPFSSAILKLYS